MENAAQAARIKLLEQKLEAVIKLLYGAKSEKIDPAQLQLLLEGLESKKPQASSEETSAPEEAAAAKSPANKNRNHSRIKGLDDLETVENTVYPDAYLADPEAYELIGREVTEQLDYRPGRCLKLLTIRPKFKLKADRNQPPILAPAPAGPLVGGLPTFDLTSELILGKYAFHLPLYRQAEMLKQGGIDIPRDSLNHWTLESLELLRPVAEAIHSEVLAETYLQIDETPIRQLAPGTGKTKKGYLWIANAPGKSVSYRWHESRSKDALIETIGPDWKGILQSDGYSVYGSYCKDCREAANASCMAHIRRKFVEALEAGETCAAPVIELIAKLYQLEEQLRQARAGPDQRLALRQEKAAPVLQQLKSTIARLQAEVRPQTLTGKACMYATGQWQGLTPYIEDGRVEIDNNLVENAVRPTKIGAKNHLFFGSKRGGELAAVAYTLIANCKLHGLDLRTYLISAMRALAGKEPVAAAQLTPAAVAERLAESSAA